MRASFIICLFAIFVAGCLASQKKPHAPLDENMRYLYITVYPDQAIMTITVEFKGDTPTFRDSRVTKIHEPVPYSINRKKVKRIHILVEKRGWIKQEREWFDEVPFDVFIKLETIPVRKPRN